MTLYKCVRAYMALEPLLNMECNFKSAYCFARLHSKLQPHVEFYVRKEQELITEFSQKDKNGKPVMTQDGRFVFADHKNPADFSELHSELDNINVDTDFEVESVQPPGLISAATIIALEGFVAFTPTE